ncbi:MAG: hypothetical protein HEQ28_03205 [Prevotella sp.]
MDELEKKSLELKELLSIYDTQWFLGMLSFLMTCITNGTAENELGKLSSPMRQLYFLGGLMMTGKESDEHRIEYTDEEWERIVLLLNDIEAEYFKIFMPKEGEQVTEEWKKKRMVAMPSFLSYFNQGPLNFEEQSISWIRKVYTPMDSIVNERLGLTTDDFLAYYDNVDKWCNDNFQMFSLTNPKEYPMRDNWKEYTNMPAVISVNVSELIKDTMASRLPLMTFVRDYGIKTRFRTSNVVSERLSNDKVDKITSLLCCKRKESNFLYYTSTTPGNPLYSTPIIKIAEDMYQVFEVKQLLHAIEALLNDTCSSDVQTETKLNKKKGDVLEDGIEELCNRFFGNRVKKYRSYYVDGCEQDLLVLWKDYAFIIEAKNYKKKEPFRNPERAFKRIKQEFDKSIGYAFTQCKRVSKYFNDGTLFDICDSNGNVIETIDPTKYQDGDFSIIINVASFGQIQTDLSYLLELEDGDRYPWAIKYDDFEVFLLTLMQKKKNPYFLVDFLIMREYLHKHLVCSDELEICGAYLTGDITDDMAKDESTSISTMPNLADIFDEQYRKGMGFVNEKYWKEKHSGKTLFW